MLKCETLTFVAHLLTIYFFSSVKGFPPTSQNVTGISGMTLLLNCTIGPNVGQVTWMRPMDNAVVSRNYDIVNLGNERRPGRLMVIGDYTKGEFNLLIRYAIFPQDSGTWLCSSESQTRKVNVVLLVRPNVEVPQISPSLAAAENLATGDKYSLKTFTCTAQFAFPPVQLAWRKEFGPDAPYHTSLPSIVVSRVGLMSSSVRLTLSMSNVGSTFVCVASHPAFMGKTYQQELHYHLGQNIEPQPLVHESQAAKPVTRTSLTQFDTLDRVFLLLLISVIAAGFAVGILMNKFHSKWQLDVPVKRIDQNLNTKSLCEVVDGEKVKRPVSSKAQRRFAIQVLLCLVLFVLLILSLVFAFPIYFKGVTIPTVDADEITSVVAGSALWLDCRLLAQPPTSVLQINWLHNGQPFYHQYYTNGQTIGFPDNSTKGFTMGIRVSSQGVGQVTIWPVAPGEDGRYTCWVLLSSGDDGTSEQREMSTAVFVLMGPIINYGLIVMLVVALTSSILIFILFVYRTLRIPRKAEEEKVEDEEI